MEFIFEDSQDEESLPDNISGTISDNSSGKIVYMNNPGLFIDLFFEKNAGKKHLKLKTGSGKIKLMFKLIPVVICIALVVFFTWSKVRSSPEFKLKQMFSQGEYEKCIKSVLLILENDPDNEKLKRIAEESFIGKILEKGWAEKLEKGFFADAQNILTQDKHLQYNNEIQSIINLLMWIIDIEDYFITKKTDAQLVIFKDEIMMKSLIDRWNNEKADIRNLFNQSLTQDKLEKIRHRVYQHLDMLQSQYYLYFNDILALKNTIKDKLDADHPGSLGAIIEEFHKKHPGIGGIKKINEDLSNYIKITQAIKSGQLTEYTALIRKMNFQTGPFAEKIKSILTANGLDKQNDKEKISPFKSPPAPAEHDYSIVKISELKVMPELVERPDSYESSGFLVEKSGQIAMQDKIISDNK